VGLVAHDQVEVTQPGRLGLGNRVDALVGGEHHGHRHGLICGGDLCDQLGRVRRGREGQIVGAQVLTH
jgi:hypothetical protein